MLSLILTTLPGIITVVRFEHSENAESPIPVTLSGMVILVRPEQPLNV